MVELDHFVIAGKDKVYHTRPHNVSYNLEYAMYGRSKFTFENSEIQVFFLLQDPILVGVCAEPSLDMGLVIAPRVLVKFYYCY